MIRQPAVAGAFYPASKDEILKMFSMFGPAEGKAEPALGVVAPHAGYVYSGKTAYKTYSKVKVPERVVVLAPNHTGAGPGISFFAKGIWRTPMGDVEVDEDLAEKIMSKIKGAESDFSAHYAEHSLEVHLPFLLHINPNIKIVPVVLKYLSLEKCLEIGSAVAEVISQISPKPLIVASSDMTHYESAESARAKDRRAIERILELDPEGLYEVVRSGNISMCGVVPVTSMLSAVKKMGATRAELVSYSNSGEVNGDMDSVVGYAGIVIRE